MPVPPEVLDLFAVPDVVEPVPGGRGTRVRAGDLVLSPGRDAATAAWLNPVLARLAVRLDEQPDRRRRDLRIAMPVPARDGSWVVQGWGASRWEPGTVVCRDLDVTRATGRIFHARLASVVDTRPPALAERQDRWAVAERLAFTPADQRAEPLPDLPVVRRVAGLLDDTPIGPDQLVHADLAGNVLLDGEGAPVVVDVAPAWRPARWAEALVVLDSVLRIDADPAALLAWRTGADLQAMLRAILSRVLVDRAEDGGREVDPRYDEAVSVLAGELAG